jgi:DNA-binding MarR family transcriptional regulator
MARTSRTATAEQAALPSPELAERLRLTLARFSRRLRRQHAPGLSPTQMTVLAAVESASLTLGELAAQEHVQPPTMTVVVHRLQEQGLVERCADDRDRRVVRVQITETGRLLLAERRVYSNAYVTKLIDLLTDDERRTLSRAVEVLDGVLDRERLRRPERRDEGATAAPSAPVPPTAPGGRGT